MSGKSKIEWTDYTWGPIRGCSKVSSGCQNCYAERMAARFSGPGQPYEGLTRDGKWTGEVRLVPSELEKPLRWKKPRRIFVCSMSDLFHEKVPFEFIDKLFRIMAACPHHTFVVLTKRPARLLEFERIISAVDAFRDATGRSIGPLVNVWLGVSVEDQKTADERIPLLLECPAAKRAVSIEPCLGPIDLMYPKTLYPYGPPFCCNGVECGCRGLPLDPPLMVGLGGAKIDWVIMGSESGPGARHFDWEWARVVRDQCQMASVPFFLKQGHLDGKLVKMPELDGRVWQEVPE